jgi:hypothetical protein
MVEVDPLIVSVSGAVAAIIASISTAVLAKITNEYMKETRLIRLSAQRPSFSLEPTTYALGGFFQVNLVNYGQVANNIL